MKSYRTIQGTAEAAYEIQKSRFLTHVSHAASEEEARAFIQARKKEFFDARHNCSAYVLGAEGAKQKSNDDGEPGGTAGNPMLEAIKQQGLTDVVVVVTRYFGGIKLGAGGLIRAYHHSAMLGLSVAVTDETIQLFSHRGSQIGDVLIDAGGLLLSLVFIEAVIRVRNRKES